MEKSRSLFGFIALVSIFFATSCKTSHPFSEGDIKAAQKLSGVYFEAEHIRTMHDYLERNLESYEAMRKQPLDHDVLPAMLFQPLPRAFVFPQTGESCQYTPDKEVIPPDNMASLAFATVAELSYLIKNQLVTSEALTRMYISRIKDYDHTLQSVITLMEDRAIAAAKKADKEIQKGFYRGPLHGIPYGLKDLASVSGFPTTWGATPYRDQIIDHDATIYKKLENAGAILVAKLVSGALARGDVWFGGKTVNPWDTLQGASGSSAGSASATSAGLVAFSIGTETMGSITSPSNRNGVTGLRPTYGRVSRDGFMPLSWSMDKVGPICRSAEDCALVFQAIQGKDSLDPTTYDIPFCYKPDIDLKKLRIGILDSLFAQDTAAGAVNNDFLLELLVDHGFTMIPDSLPKGFPFQAFDIILRAESGAFFDELVTSGKVGMMVQQGSRSRANSLRQSRFIPAVEYLQANRHRTLLIEAMHKLMSKYDVLLSPTFGGRQLQITNLTGHPVVTIPTGLDSRGHPYSITLIGNLFEESKILALAQYIQEITDFEEQRPPLFKVE